MSDVITTEKDGEIQEDKPFLETSPSDTTSEDITNIIVDDVECNSKDTAEFMEGTGDEMIEEPNPFAKNKNATPGASLEMDSELKGLIDDYESNLENDYENHESGTDDSLEIGCDNSLETRSAQSKRCCGCYRVGRCIVVCNHTYKLFGWGIIGPHVPGIICTYLLLSSLSFYFVVKAISIGRITTFIALTMTSLSSINLFSVAFRDPGFIHQHGRSECRKFLTRSSSESTLHMSRYRYCSMCKVYQPPDARHCNHCKLCVVGYDHHCPWLGICIGKFNMRHFLAFNCSWLVWLIFSVGWISIGSKALRKG